MEYMIEKIANVSPYLVRGFTNESLKLLFTIDEVSAYDSLSALYGSKDKELANDYPLFGDDDISGKYLRIEDHYSMMMALLHFASMKSIKDRLHYGDSFVTPFGTFYFDGERMITRITKQARPVGKFTYCAICTERINGIEGPWTCNKHPEAMDERWEI
jgi:hypothetical protein